MAKLLGTFRNFLQQKEFSQKYIQIKQIGEGCQGTVFLTKRKRTGSRSGLDADSYATKIQPNNRNSKREVSLLKKLGVHENIVRMLECYTNRSHVFIVLEFCPDGDLFEILESCSDYCLTVKAVADYTCQILCGVMHLHSHNILHLDLKPENILRVKTPPTGPNATTEILKITDFGLAIDLEKTPRPIQPDGTIDYSAPEVLRGEVLTKQTDIWSLGVIAYILLSGLSPWGEEDEDEDPDEAAAKVQHNILTLNYSYDFPEFDNLGYEAREFIDSIMNGIPRLRATAKQLLESDFIKYRNGDDVISPCSSVSALSTAKTSNDSGIFTGSQFVQKLRKSFKKSKTPSGSSQSSDPVNSKEKKPPVVAKPIPQIPRIVPMGIKVSVSPAIQVEECNTENAPTIEEPDCVFKESTPDSQDGIGPLRKPKLGYPKPPPLGEVPTKFEYPAGDRRSNQLSSSQNVLGLPTLERSPLSRQASFQTRLARSLSINARKLRHSVKRKVGDNNVKNLAQRFEVKGKK